MFGKFLEVSLHTGDIAASVQFYERLGFSQLTTGDTWTHPYGVLSDGRVCIGLHQRIATPARYAVPARSPVLSFVRPDLVRHLADLRATGFLPLHEHLGDGDFHTVHFEDPLGQAVTLLEARTFSPPRGDFKGSLCGWFSAFSMPAASASAVQEFWERAGFVALETNDDPLAHTALTSDSLTLTLHQPRVLGAAALVFADPKMSERIEQLAAKGVPISNTLPAELSRQDNALLEAPEGTLLLLLSSEI